MVFKCRFPPDSLACCHLYSVERVWYRNGGSGEHSELWIRRSRVQIPPGISFHMYRKDFHSSILIYALIKAGIQSSLSKDMKNVALG